MCKKNNYNTHDKFTIDRGVCMCFKKIELFFEISNSINYFKQSDKQTITMANQQIQKFCDDFILFLLQVRDENQVIMRKIYEEDWTDEDDREIWIDAVLLNYLANGMAYKNVDKAGFEDFIPGYDIQSWNQDKQFCNLLEEITKDEHDDEIEEIYDSLMNWRIEHNGFYHSLIFNYCYRYLYDRTHDDLLTMLKNLVEENTIMPK